MSPVSLVYYTVETVKIGLKTQLEWEHPFHRIICPCWSAECSTFLFSFHYKANKIRPQTDKLFDTIYVGMQIFSFS